MAQITQTKETYSPRSPGIISGAFVGGVIIAPIIAIMLVADQLLGLPFVPFDFFDWLARTLPGDIVRFGINIFVDLIETFELGETSSAAKTLEHVQAIVSVLGIGVVSGAVTFGILKATRSKRIYGIGTIVGLALGIFFALITLEVNFTSTASDSTQFIWVLTLFIIWGAAVAWIYDDLSSIGATAHTEDDVKAAQMNRRQFLVSVGGTTATLTVMGGAVGALLNLQPNDNVSTGSGVEIADLPDGLPNSDANVMPAPGTRPEYTPLDDHYRIDISARPPIINGETWRLKVEGLVERPLEISLDELQNNYEPVDRFVTMECISNRLAGDLISTTRWTGIPLHMLLDEWGLEDSATHLRIISADGFDEWVSTDLIYEDERIMLCYAWDGQPLKQKHGFPLRIWIPDRFGMKQPKWITEIQVVDSWGEGYWVERNWDEDAMIQPTSVIDTVATNAAYENGETLMIPIGGIAFTGARGVSKVEVSIDSEDWQEATLREPLSDTTWVLWRYDWPFASGAHTFEVRCYTADGTLQPTEMTSHFPDGATGVHEVRTRIPDDLTPAETTSTVEESA